METRRDKLNAMLQRTPDDTFLIYGLALEHLKDGEVDEGIRRLSGLVERDPNYHAAYFQLGQACLQIGETEQARDWLEQGVIIARKMGNDHAAAEMEGLLLTI